MTISTWKLTKDTTPRKRRFIKDSKLRKTRFYETFESLKVDSPKKSTFRNFWRKIRNFIEKRKTRFFENSIFFFEIPVLKFPGEFKKKCEFGSGWKMYIFVKTSTWIVYRVYLASLFTRHLNLFFYWTYTHWDKLRTNRPDKNLIRAYYLLPGKCRENVRKWPKIFEKNIKKMGIPCTTELNRFKSNRNVGVLLLSRKKAVKEVNHVFWIAF